MLLAIDTSAGTSVAIIDAEARTGEGVAGLILAEESEPDTRRHAEVIGVLISGVLASAGIRPADIEAVVAGMGPGPFTGLRVGIAAARTFALAVGRPVIPVVSHDAVAFGRTRPTLVVTDARRREVAWSTYEGSDAAGVPVRLSGPHLARPEELETAVQLETTAADFARFERIDAAEISAGALGLLAARRRAADRPPAPDEPLYLRAPDVTVSGTPKRVTG